MDQNNVFRQSLAEKCNRGTLSKEEYEEAKRYRDFIASKLAYDLLLDNSDDLPYQRR